MKHRQRMKEILVVFCKSCYIYILNTLFTSNTKHNHEHFYAKKCFKPLASKLFFQKKVKADKM